MVTLFFLENPTDLNEIDVNLLSSAQIFSFNIYGHKILEKKKIIHKIAEDYLNENDKTIIFDTAVSHYDWYKKSQITTTLEFEGVNLLELLDTAELHQLLVYGINNFLIIKRIIEKDKPEKIIASKYHSEIIKSISNTIDVVQYDTKLTNPLAWNTIQIKFNIGRLPISFNLSRNRYLKLKEIFENAVSNIFGFWFNFNNKATILLLEFDPSAYKELLTYLSKSNKNILLYNRRKSAIWNMSPIKILYKTKCKLLNFKKIESRLQTQIMSLVNSYSGELEKIWHNDALLNSFTVDRTTFWYGIKNNLISAYRKRLREYVSLLVVSKYLLANSNIRCIVSLNVVGESEKSILHVNKQKIPSIMLEHGYVNLAPKTEKYAILNMYTLFKDKIAVWGQVQKQYLEQRKISNDRIYVVGSQKYDSLFNRRTKSMSKQKIILLALHPITHITGKANTNSYIRFENFLTRLCDIVANISDVNMIVKLHPSQDTHNADIKKILKKIDKTIPIYYSKPITELISISDVLVTVSPEGFDPSSVILEAIILEKPVMNVILDNDFHEFQYVKDNAVVSVSDDDLDLHLKNLLFDEKLRNTLIQNGRLHLRNYLSNPGSASEYFASILEKF